MPKTNSSKLVYFISTTLQNIARKKRLVADILEENKKNTFYRLKFNTK